MDERERDEKNINRIKKALNIYFLICKCFVEIQPK